MNKLSPIALSLALATGNAAAFEERQSLETLRQTTLSLIEVLVESGVLTREKADALLAEARQRAERTLAEETPAGAIRVTYVPETVRNEIRDQLKQEVLAQAREERWAAPNAIPDWINRIKLEGDLRLRYQTDSYPSDNTPAADYVLAAQNESTRAADFSTVDPNLLPAGNTQRDLSRWRVRARLGVLAQISSGVSAGLRLATGNTGDRVSTNQTLGQNLNKYTFVVDRAYLRLNPTESITLTGGRIPNPWLSTDLMWDSDLNFEGVAAAWRYADPSARLRPFVTVGYFPIRAEDPPSRPDGRSLIGAQIGAAWDVSPMNRLRFGAALYEFHNFEGVREPNSTISEDAFGDEFVNTSDYGSTQYERGLRQKGNTLFATNALNDTTQPFFFGLASEFRPLNLTGVWDLGYWDPLHVLLSADYVINTAFDRSEIRRRSGLDVSDASANAWRLGVTVGRPSISERGDWNASFVYKRIGSDALLDAFTDSDFGHGGTNLKGYVLGFAYGLDRRTSLGLTYYTADTIASPTLVDGDKFGVDTLQLDLAVKF